jgi:arylsulfatase A-like enzyme
MNILFIMFDQLRFDYLGCLGHPFLQTPHLDGLAEQSLRFSHCYVQSPICGASRMCFYTGRYVSSHGAAWNGIPLRVGEMTIGDHLREAGRDAFVIGKTHMRVDAKGLARLGLAPDSVIGARVAECGFDIWLRDDGLWGKGPDGDYDERDSPYNQYLRDKGYESENPWHDFANAGIDEEGNIASGWIYGNSHLQANIREEDSETPWLTREAIKFLEDKKKSKTPWMCHVSYVKPHWPYIAPAPYHEMYGPNTFLEPVRHEDELVDPNPIYAAFAGNVIGTAFQNDEVRGKVLGAYMGLIKQIDDQMGVLLNHLKASGQMDNTMIVITSDHGDYLGDHWLGEKDLFHDPSVKVPLIIYDPSSEADATRGQVCDALVESIDLAATFTDYINGKVPDEWIEGLSLKSFLHGEVPEDWRDFAVSEYDYSMLPMAAKLGVEAKDARLFMVASKKWKFMHAEGGMPPMLFDLETDPDELVDLGRDPDYQDAVQDCYDKLLVWALRCGQRVTFSDDELVSKRGKSRRKGIVLGIKEESDAEGDILKEYLGKPGSRPL